MTFRAPKALDSLPPKVWAQIERLALTLKESPQSIVQKAVQLFDDSHRTSKVKSSEAARGAASISCEATAKAEFKAIMSGLAKRTAEGMTPAQKKARAEAGGRGRARKLTAAQRKNIARKAAQKRWAKVRGGA